jgi:hypothetical protein
VSQRNGSLFWLNSHIFFILDAKGVPSRIAKYIWLLLAPSKICTPLDKLLFKNKNKKKKPFTKKHRERIEKY